MRNPYFTKKPGAKKYFNNRRYRVKKVVKLKSFKGEIYKSRRKVSNKW